MKPSYTTVMLGPPGRLGRLEFLLTSKSIDSLDFLLPTCHSASVQLATSATCICSICYGSTALYMSGPVLPIYAEVLRINPWHGTNQSTHTHGTVPINQPIPMAQYQSINPYPWHSTNQSTHTHGTVPINQPIPMGRYQSINPYPWHSTNQSTHTLQAIIQLYSDMHSPWHLLKETQAYDAFISIRMNWM